MLSVNSHKTLKLILPPFLALLCFKQTSSCVILCIILYNSFFFFFNDTATTEIYPFPLHDALPICGPSVFNGIPKSSFKRRPPRTSASLPLSPERSSGRQLHGVSTLPHQSVWRMMPQVRDAMQQIGRAHV